MGYEEATFQEQPRPLVLNGLPLKVSVGSAAKPLVEVMDWFERRCARDTGSPRPAARPSASGVRDPFRAIHRMGDDESAALACGEAFQVVPGSDPTWLQWVGGREEGLSGKYVYAQRRRGRTAFVVSWTERPFDLIALFPPDRDAPGRDPSDLGRPPGMRRMMSMEEVGRPYGIFVYGQREGRSDDLARFYRRDLPARGWAIVEPRRPLPADGLPESIFARRRGDLTVIVLDRDDEGALVTILKSSGHKQTAGPFDRRPAQ